mmetsp:Transcript_34290/g.50202  ORF Transcript_34290/g.50202 Transcript_34290/m.50202 type:complete len:268 (-) Transcript_34290:267-1070(-)
MTETNLRRPARSPNKATAFCHSSAALTSCMLSEKPVAHILSTAQISREYARRDSARQHPTRERGAAASTSQYDTCFSSNHALPSNNCSYCGTNDNAMIGADTTNRLALHDTQSTRTELRNTDSAAVAQKYRQCCCRNGSSPSSSHGATGQDTRKLAAALRLIKSELLRAREYGSKSEYVGAYTTAASTVASRHEQQAVVRAALDYPTKEASAHVLSRPPSQASGRSSGLSTSAWQAEAARSFAKDWWMQEVAKEKYVRVAMYACCDS